MKTLAVAHFQSLRITLPTTVGRSTRTVVAPPRQYTAQRVPTGMAMVRSAGVSGSSGSGQSSPIPQRGTPASCPPSLFVAASNDLADCNDQRDTSQAFENYIDGVCTAICAGWSNWQSKVVLTGVQVNAVIAFGGQVIGPSIETMILASAPKWSEWQTRRSNAISIAMGMAFRDFSLRIRVPGLPWYPAFAAFPAPVAPPTPNIPVPLAAICGGRITAAWLKNEMMHSFGAPNEWSTELFESIATAVEECFALWVTSTMVTNVMGTGPIPTFAPPYVPVGPVVGGTANMIPGGFA